MLPKNSLQSTTEAPKSVNVLQEVEAIEGDVDLQQRLILSPLSYFKIRWDVLVMLCVIVVSIQIPFQIGFNIESEGFLSLFDIVVNAIFILDMLLLFRCAYFDSNTELFITIVLTLLFSRNTLLALNDVTEAGIVILDKLQL